MTRPRGEIRQVLSAAARELAAERGGATWRDMAARACVGYAAARQAVKDMARAGELQPCGTVRMPHARRPMVRWAPAANWTTAATAPAAPASSALAGVLRAWTC